jgi:hypothetical protein
MREDTLEDLDAASRGQARPPVIAENMRHTVLRRRADGETAEQIQPDLIIPTGKREGRDPDVAGVYRALAAYEKAWAYPQAAPQTGAAAVVVPRPGRRAERGRLRASGTAGPSSPSTSGQGVDLAPGGNTTMTSYGSRQIHDDGRVALAGWPKRT